MLGQKEIRHIAALARLHIPDERMEQMSKDMNSILAMVDKLSGLKGEAQVLDSLPTMPAESVREDVVRPSQTREAVLANAPESYAGCFVVPKMVE